MGRPKLNVDPQQVYKLARIGCTNREIAYVVGMSESAVEKRFSSILAKGREGAKTRLRKLQWKAAAKGNVAMLIWLGKNILGQTDKLETTNAVTIDSIKDVIAGFASQLGNTR